MDWFLHDRDLRHERVKTKFEANKTTPGNIFIIDLFNLYVYVCRVSGRGLTPPTPIPSQFSCSLLTIFILKRVLSHCTKNEVLVIDFFSKCDQICRKLRIWSHLPKKSLMENFIFHAASGCSISSLLDSSSYLFAPTFS